MTKRCVSWGGWLAAAVWLVGAVAPALGQARFGYSADGSEVTDSRTGLVWRRCSAGQAWSGSTCTGSAGTFTHEQALAYAQTQGGWRLPNVKELASLADRNRSNPAIDPAAFPGTPSEWYWTSSPVAGGPDDAWYVGFHDGYVDSNGRSGSGYHVRLVR